MDIKRRSIVFKFFFGIIQILRVMKNLPIGVRNTVQDSGLEAFVTRFIDHPDEEIVVDAKQIIEKWMSLKIVYKIPKLKVIPKQVCYLIFLYRYNHFHY